MVEKRRGVTRCSTRRPTRSQRRALRAQRGAKAYRAGHYERDLTVKAGKLSWVPKLKGAVFESAVIERYRRREESVEEALIDMYLAGVSTPAGRRCQPGCCGATDAVPDPERQAQKGVRRHRRMAWPPSNRITRTCSWMWHKRCWGGSVENVSILVAVGVGMDGRREVLGSRA